MLLWKVIAIYPRQKVITVKKRKFEIFLYFIHLKKLSTTSVKIKSKWMSLTRLVVPWWTSLMLDLKVNDLIQLLIYKIWALITYYLLNYKIHNLFYRFFVGYNFFNYLMLKSTYQKIINNAWPVSRYLSLLDI